MAAATMAICSGVARVSPCPNEPRKTFAGPAVAGKKLDAELRPGSTWIGLKKPNLVAWSLTTEVLCWPYSANVVLQDWANDSISGGVPLTLQSDFTWLVEPGTVATAGVSTGLDSVLPLCSIAAATTDLNEDPGGKVSLNALLVSPCRVTPIFCCAVNAALALVPSWLEEIVLGSKEGYDAATLIAPVLSSMKTTAER